jgi:hypothetical protein
VRKEANSNLPAFAMMPSFHRSPSWTITLSQLLHHGRRKHLSGAEPALLSSSNDLFMNFETYLDLVNGAVIESLLFTLSTRNHSLSQLRGGSGRK